MAYTPKTSNEAVIRATGKDWAAWFQILDKAGMQSRAHKDIAQWISDKFLKHKQWWAQMVTVEYERTRGMREVNQTKSGYTVSVHRTADMPLSQLYKLWREEARENKALRDARVTTAKKNKTLRYALPNGERLIVAFSAEDKKKARIGIQCERLASKGKVSFLRQYWTQCLDHVLHLPEEHLHMKRGDQVDGHDRGGFRMPPRDTADHTSTG